MKETFSWRITSVKLSRSPFPLKMKRLTRSVLSSAPFLRSGCCSVQKRGSSSTAGPSAARNSPMDADKELDRIVAALEKDDGLLEGVVANMEPHHRRRLVVAGGAMEWFGKESVATEVERADPDKDLVISPKDFDNWFVSALKRKAESHGVASDAAATPAGATADNGGSRVGDVPLRALVLIAIEAGLPFVGFGFLDNATMILAGDLIDHSVGFYLNCSVMASAAMGNVVSGVMGMQVHGLVEKAVHKLNLNTPILTDAQRKGRRVFMAGHIGGTIGIMTGLTLGMLPLLLIRTDEEGSEGRDVAAVFHNWDANHDGLLDVGEIMSCLKEMELDVSEATIRRLVEHFSPEGSLTLHQMKQLCHDIRRHQLS